MTCVQLLPNVFDVGPTLYKCYTNVLCLPDLALYLSVIIMYNVYLKNVLLHMTMPLSPNLHTVFMYTSIFFSMYTFNKTMTFMSFLLCQ